MALLIPARNDPMHRPATVPEGCDDGWVAVVVVEEEVVRGGRIRAGGNGGLVMLLTALTFIQHLPPLPLATTMSLGALLIPLPASSEALLYCSKISLKPST